MFVQARSKVDRTQTGFPLIGMTPGLTDYQPELHITAGRMFTPGVRELIASNKCVRQYTDFGVGAKRHMRGGDWRVVGNFDLAEHRVYRVRGWRHDSVGFRPQHL